MNCEILSTLYIKSNGHILCNDDYGERVELGEIKLEDPWTLNNLFSNSKFNHIRNKLKGGEEPWGDICKKCAFLRPFEEYQDNLSKEIIRKVQIETTLACALDCSGCSRKQQLKTQKGTKVLSIDQYEKLLCSIKKENFTVDWIEYCGQGEPLNHPDFETFVWLTNQYLPFTRQRLITNGNHSYQKKIGSAPLDEIIVSCDGAQQKSYSQYRKGGKIEKAFSFLQNAVESKTQHPKTVIWKYILFEFNDSDNEVAMANQKASELSVDRLLFVETHSEFHSKKYHEENLKKVLFHAPMASINSTPIHYKYKHSFQLIQQSKTQIGLLKKIIDSFYRSTIIHCIDEAFFLRGKIFIKGWAFCNRFHPIKKMRLVVGHRSFETANVHLIRNDVKGAHHELQSVGVGFSIIGEIGNRKSESLPIVLYFYPKKGFPIKKFYTIKAGDSFSDVQY